MCALHGCARTGSADMAIPYIREFSAPYESDVRVSPLITRVLANNPGPFTFMGTGVYIVGGKDVAVIDPGPDFLEHVEALKRALDGKRVTHILVTHTHSDHSPAAKPLKKWSGAKSDAARRCRSLSHARRADHESQAVPAGISRSPAGTRGADHRLYSRWREHDSGHGGAHVCGCGQAPASRRVPLGAGASDSAGSGRPGRE